MMPFLFAYSYSVNSTVFHTPLLTEALAKLISTITKARMVVFGHSHEPEVSRVGEVDYYNSGFWSPAFSEPECINRIGLPTLVIIRGVDGEPRSGGLYQWRPGSTEPELFSPKAPSNGVPPQKAA